MLAFELHGGVEAGQKFVEALELHSHVANIGDVRSLVIHPASTTHSQLTAEEQLTTGVTPGLVRLAVGLEGIEDILADLEAGFRAAKARLTMGGWVEGDPVGDRRLPRPARPFRARARRDRCPGVRVAYETWGTLDAGRRQRRARSSTRSPATATSSARPGPGTRPPGWWDGLIGPGRALDTDRLFVVCANVLGGCQGTTGPSSLGPGRRPLGLPLPRGDRRRPGARSRRRSPTPSGIDRWACVVGGSMGGMRALEWAVAMPDRVAHAVLPGLGRRRHRRPDRHPDHPAGRDPARPALARRRLRPLADPPVAGLGIARRIAHLTYRSAFELGERFGTRGRRTTAASPSPPTSTTTPTSWPAGSTPAATCVLTETMNTRDVGRGRGGVEAALARVTARSLVAGVDSDRLYPLALQQQVADALGVPLQVIASPYGHDGFLIEVDAVGELLSGLLAGR